MWGFGVFVVWDQVRMKKKKERASCTFEGTFTTLFFSFPSLTHTQHLLTLYITFRLSYILSFILWLSNFQCLCENIAKVFSSCFIGLVCVFLFCAFAFVLLRLCCCWVANPITQKTLNKTKTTIKSYNILTSFVKF